MAKIDIGDYDAAVVRALVDFLYRGRCTVLRRYLPQLMACAHHYESAHFKDECEKALLATNLSYVDVCHIVLYGIDVYSRTLYRAAVNFIIDTDKFPPPTNYTIWTKLQLMSFTSEELMRRWKAEVVKNRQLEASKTSSKSADFTQWKVRLLEDKRRRERTSLKNKIDKLWRRHLSKAEMKERLRGIAKELSNDGSD